MSAAAAGSGVTRAPSRNATKCTQVAWPRLARARFSATGPPKSVPARRSRRLCMRWYRLFLSPPRCAGARADAARRVCARQAWEMPGPARGRRRACVEPREGRCERIRGRAGHGRLFKCCVCCAARLRLRFRSRTELGMGAEKGCRSLRWWSWPAAGWAKGKRAKAAGPLPSPWSAWSGDGDTSTPHLTSPCARRRARMHACEPCHPCLPRAAQRVPSAPASLRTGTYSYAVV